MRTTNSIGINKQFIGKHEWTTKNLNVDKFRNGDPIPEAKTNEEWKKAGENGLPAWCYYNNNLDNGKRYGKLYNGYAVSDPRGLAPKGWHIPSDKEWTELTDFLGGLRDAGKRMKNTDSWFEDGRGSGNGNNQSGFSGFPGGFRDNAGNFHYVGQCGNWWSATIYLACTAWHRSLGKGDNVSRHYSDTISGLSVRCLKD
jgi:uncharacterized protein (TIGR02145 family)